MAEASDTQPYEIAIVGGGMVGLALGVMLARGLRPWRIALIESHPLATDLPLYQPSFDARATALSADSVGIFRSLGVWDGMARHATAIDAVHVSDRGHAGHTRYCREDNAGEALGQVVDNRWLGRCLAEAAMACEGLSLLTPYRATKLGFFSGSAELTLAGTEARTLQARLVIAADGAASALREGLGIACDRHDYGQAALIANVAFERAHGGVAYERFTARGPLALLPLGESPSAKQAALVWTTPVESLAEVLALSEGEFLWRLQQTFGYRLGRFLRVGERSHYPLQRVTAREQVRSRFLLMGNAAHFLHPVAGQGFNLALRDCEALLAELQLAQGRGHDPGALAVLQAYLARQQGDQWLTGALSHGFTALFSRPEPALKALRSAALLGMNALPPLRHALFQRMMGRGSTGAGL